jgi:hypothetical protein
MLNSEWGVVNVVYGRGYKVYLVAKVYSRTTSEACGSEGWTPNSAVNLNINDGKYRTCLVLRAGPFF